MLLSHGFPVAPRGAAAAASTYPELADWLAAETGWIVMAFNFRGAGASKGQFSLAGWMDDLRAMVAYLAGRRDVGGVWLAGFRTGGSLSVCLAADDPQVRGVAALASHVDFERWAADPRRLLDEARSLGVITQAGFPPDLEAWARPLRTLRPLEAASSVPPRPFLIVHGTDDTVVPLVDARALGDAAHNHVEFRVLSGAGHHLRHDPRAVSILLGWMERQER